MKTIRRQPRPGFSLLELLIVISIIGFLAAVLAFTIPNIITSARVASTRATIKKVNELLTKRMHAITRELQDQDQRAGTGDPAYLADSPYTAVTPRARALVLARKHFIRRHLPMTQAEADRVPTGATAAEQNAEMLYFFLTQGPQFDAAPVETDAFRSSELADTDGDGAQEIIDSWGHPLRFYRWPTRLLRPAAAGSESTPQGVTGGTEYTLKLRPDLLDVVPGVTARVLISAVSPSVGPVTFTDELNEPLAKDPDDPLGLGATDTPPPTSDEARDFENDFHTPDTWHTPLVVSAGRDGLLGLFEPTDTANHGHLAQPDLTANGLEALLDNITNRQE